MLEYKNEFSKNAPTIFGAPCFGPGLRNWPQALQSLWNTRSYSSPSCALLCVLRDQFKPQAGSKTGQGWISRQTSSQRTTGTVRAIKVNASHSLFAPLCALSVGFFDHVLKHLQKVCTMQRPKNQTG